MSYTGFVIVAAVAFLAPLALGLVPSLRVPGIVLEIVAGIVLGPHVLGLVSLDAAIEVFAQVGLALLLFLAGQEIRLHQMSGRVLRMAGLCFTVTLALAAGTAAALGAVGMVEAPLLVAIILVATSVSVIIVPLKDAHETRTRFGQLVIAGASLAEFGAIVLLSLFFSGRREGPVTELLHIGLFAVLALALAATLGRGGQLARLSAVLDRLADTTAQLRVRADFALVAVAVGLASELGVEAILAAFTVGVIRGLGEERDSVAQEKVEAIAFGIFVPFFFVATGLQLDVASLFDSLGSALSLPVFLAALLVVHLGAALAYRGEVGGRHAMAAGFLQATSLTFVVVAAQLGVGLSVIQPSTAAALVGAGLLSVVLFPAVGLALARGQEPARAAPA